MLKTFLLFFSISIIYLTGYSQGTTEKINSAILVEIINKGDFVLFKKLVGEVGYPLADSSNDNYGAVNYITRQAMATGNTLGVSLNKEFKITLLNFSTYEKIHYAFLKKQFLGLGFLSNGKKKISDKEESEDFQKDNIFIGTSAEIIKGRPVEYSFYLFRQL